MENTNASYEKQVLIDKSLIDKLKRFSRIPSIETQSIGDKYLISYEDVTYMYNIIKGNITANIIEELSTKYPSISMGKIDKDYSDFLDKNYRRCLDNAERDEDNKLNKDKELEELCDAVKAAIKVIEDKQDIESASMLVDKIRRMIEEINSSIPDKDISGLIDRFKEAQKSAESVEIYKDIYKHLENIIVKTYIEKINDIDELSNSQELAFIGSIDNEQFELITTQNMERYSYGYIYDPQHIVGAKNNKNDKDFLTYSSLDKKNNYIEIEHKVPIGMFVVTAGEKELNKAYVDAQNAAKEYEEKNDTVLPVIEIDVTKYLIYQDQIPYLNRVIRSLMDQKNILNEVITITDFKPYEIFYGKFEQAKKRNASIDEIYSAFELCFNLINAQSCSKLSVLLGKPDNESDDIVYNVSPNTINYSIPEIMTALNHNKHMGYNIFRYNKVTAEMVEKFLEEFYPYKDDKTLNTIYLGINDVLEYLHNLMIQKPEELPLFVLGINKKFENSPNIDSWGISNEINPRHSLIPPVVEGEPLEVETEEQDVKKVSEIEVPEDYHPEITDLSVKQMLQFLKSKDDEKRAKEEEELYSKENKGRVG